VQRRVSNAEAQRREGFGELEVIGQNEKNQRALVVRVIQGQVCPAIERGLAVFEWRREDTLILLDSGY
jgi:hypothetical protein